MPSSTRAIRVLHVEDDPDFADLTAEFMERKDDRISVETASDASEGLDRLGQHSYDCIVSDFDMPGQDGIEFLEAVREDYPELPFVLYTGKGSEEVASDAISAGVTDYLQKGSGTSQYEVLVNRIQNAVEQDRIRREKHETEKRLQTIAENTNDILWKFTADWDELLFVNSPYEEIWGRSIEELRAEPQSFLKGIHPEDRPHVRAAMERLSNGESVDIEYRVNADEDFSRWVWVQGEPVFGEDGEVEKVVGFARDVTDWKEREKELTRVKGEFETVFNNVQDSLFMAEVSGPNDDPEFRISRLNPANEELLGVSADAATGQTPTEIFGEEIGAEITEHYRQCFERGEPISYEEELDLEAGKRIFETTLTPVEIDGEIARIVGIAHDITDRRRREQELKEKQEELRLFRRLVDGSTDLLAAADTEYNLLFANERCLDYYGLSQDDIGDVALPDYLGDAWAAEIKPKLDQVLSGDSVRYQAERERSDGETSVLDIQYYPLRDDAGSIQGAVAAMRDITELKEREEELERDRARLNALFQHSLDPIVFTEFVDGEPIIREVNTAFEETFGYDEEAASDRPIDELVVPDESKKIEEAKDLNRRIEAGERVVTEVRRQTAEGVKDFLLQSTPLNPGESGTRTYATYTDITDRKEHHKQLERYETLVEVSGDPMYMLDEDGRFTYVNDALIERTGYSREKLIGESVELVMKDEHVERGEEVIRSLLSGDDRRDTFEMDLVTADGDHIPTENHLSLLYHDGEFEGTVGVLRDISERLERERELQRERDRLNQFASVVSHDLRNPLNVAEGRLELALEDHDSEHLEAVEQAHTRMHQLIDDLLTLARAGEALGEPEPVDFAELADACWQNVDTESATLRIQTESTMQVDKTRFQQLLENLLRNAVQHGGEDVTVTIGDLPKGFYVEDDGPGIPPAEREEAFDAGYSSSEDGTGFGLNIVREIAEAHGWDVTLTESNAGGARFEFTGVTTQ